MGAYSPVSVATPALLERVRRDVFEPALAELERRGAPFTGVLYAGLMVDEMGTPNVIEFNCRLGDPEAQAVLPRITSGLLEAFRAAGAGEPLPPLVARDDAAVTTVLAAQEYPETPQPGQPILVPAPGLLPEGPILFPAGTQRDEIGVLRTSGGRVLAVTAVAATFAAARGASRRGAEAIRFEGKQFRVGL